MTSTAELTLPTFPVAWRLPRPTGSPVRVAVTQITDPLCPWAYSYEPVLRALEARYGDQLVFRTVLIGLVGTVEESLARGSSAEGRALTAPRFRPYAMPITPHVRERAIASEPACLLVKATAEQGAELADALLRARCASPGTRPTSCSTKTRRSPQSARASTGSTPAPLSPTATARSSAPRTRPTGWRRAPRTPRPSPSGGRPALTAPVDRAAPERALTGLVAAGVARRFALGDDALWTAA